jgi:hypothetical protein
MHNSSENPVDYRADMALIGFTGRSVIVAAGEDHGLELARLVDAAELLRSPLFERLAERDRQLVCEVAAWSS